MASAGVLGASSNLSGVAEIDEFAVSRCHFSYVSEITSALIAHYDNTPFSISAGTNKDDLE